MHLTVALPAALRRRVVDGHPVLSVLRAGDQRACLASAWWFLNHTNAFALRDIDRAERNPAAYLRETLLLAHDFHVMLVARDFNLFFPGAANWLSRECWMLGGGAAPALMNLFRGRARPSGPYAVCDVVAELARRLPPELTRYVYPLGISAFDVEHLLCERRKSMAKRKRRRSPDTTGSRRRVRLRRLATCSAVLQIRPETLARGDDASAVTEAEALVLEIARLESELNRARARLAFWRALQREERRKT